MENQERRKELKRLSHDNIRYIQIGGSGVVGSGPSQWVVAGSITYCVDVYSNLHTNGQHNHKEYSRKEFKGRQPKGTEYVDGYVIK